MFGLFMSGAMLLVMWRHMYNQSKGDSLHLIADEATGATLRPGSADAHRAV